MSMTVVHTNKPARIVATATAVIDVVGTATYDDVLTAGLAALHESRRTLWGYGISGHRPGDVIANELVTVYADRD